MTDTWVLSVGREALLTILLVGAPVFILSVAVGLLVSLFQATTQLHEQTMAFVPKIVAVFLGFLVFGGWMLRILVDFSTRLITKMGSLP